MKLFQASLQGLFIVSILVITDLATYEPSLVSSASLHDKLLHFFCFIYLIMVLHFSQLISNKYVQYVIVALYGILIEIVQAFLPYRSFELMDILADLSGILIGSFLIICLKRLLPSY